MKELTKWIGKLLFFIMSAALISYAASRTLDFVSTTLRADDQMVGYLALFSTTGGALAWLSVFLWSSEGVAQKSIALVMIVLDVGGEIALFTTDALMQSGKNGVIQTLAPEEIRLTVLGMSALIGANIAATFAFHIFEPGNLERIEKYVADWQIDSEILKAKRETAQSIKKEIAQREAEAYAIEQYAKDRSDKTQDTRTAAEVWNGMKDKMPDWMKPKKRDDLPQAASETIAPRKLEKVQPGLGDSKNTDSQQKK